MRTDSLNRINQNQLTRNARISLACFVRWLSGSAVAGFNLEKLKFKEKRKDRSKHTELAGRAKHKYEVCVIFTTEEESELDARMAVLSVLDEHDFGDKDFDVEIDHATRVEDETST